MSADDVDYDALMEQLGLTERPRRRPGPPPGLRTVRPTTDAERVLGQIERGEVRVGPDAAREIARRHEEAYGDVWSGRSTAAPVVTEPQQEGTNTS